MELISEENDVLLIKTSKAENIVLLDVLRVSFEFDTPMWGDMDEEDVHILIANAEARLDQEEIVMTRDEFRALYSVMIDASGGVFIADFGLEEKPVKDLMATFSVIIKELNLEKLVFLNI
ncbi:MAG: hypothetical protein KAJ86_03730 [Alphaproteobacteria bacterium]|nr:hypothetical protein [Alphaproteobacteria bacterium]